MKNLIILSAPSGAGKTTICRELQKKRPELKFSVSCTTRPQRHYERDGYDYTFVTEEEFSKIKGDNGFIEFENVHGYWYGTPRSTIETVLKNNEILLLDVDVKGGVSIMETYPENSFSIFISPPSKEELVRRLQSRGSDTMDHIKKRLKRMDMEMEYENKFDCVIINEEIENTVNQVIQTIEYQMEEITDGN
tara:strand:+ start:981 stop:1556 length:576 start_codon:yes stop_codon:yes gene_type:complete